MPLVTVRPWKQAAMDKYDPSVIGLMRDEENSRIQLEPRGIRGYIEMFAVKLEGKE